MAEEIVVQLALILNHTDARLRCGCAANQLKICLDELELELGLTRCWKVERNAKARAVNWLSSHTEPELLSMHIQFA